MVLNNYFTQKLSFIIKGRLIPRVGIICFFLFLLTESLFLFAASAINSSTSNCSEQFFHTNHSSSARIKKVYDGDTIKLSDGRKIRLIGINTPELDHRYKKHQPYAVSARKQLISLLKNKKVKLIWGDERQDKYGRYLAYVYLPNGEDIQKYMLKKGLAISLVVLPNDQQLKCYRDIEAKAQATNKGIWQLEQYKPIKARQAKSSLRGYRFIQGNIKNIKHFKTASLIRLSDSFDVYIRHDIYPNIIEVLSSNQKVRVRGWVKPYKGRAQIKLAHPQNLELE